MELRIYNTASSDSLSKTATLDTKSGDLGVLIRQTDDWSTADQKVRASFANAPKASRSTLKQFGADLMLRKHLLRGEMTAEKREAIAYYTEILLDAKNPQTDLLADALERLQGKWSETRIQEAAQNAIAPARRKLNSLKNRPMLKEIQTLKDEQGPEGKGARMFLSAYEKRFNEIEKGVARLQLHADGK